MLVGWKQGAASCLGSERLKFDESGIELLDAYWAFGTPRRPLDPWRL